MGQQLNPDMTAFPQIQENNAEVCLIGVEVIGTHVASPTSTAFPASPKS